MEKELIKILDENKIEYDVNKLNSIIEYAKNIYKDSLRYTSQSVIDHSIGVATEVAKLKLDINSVYASILHEVVKFDVDMNDIKEKFGAEVVDLIKGVGRLSYLSYNSDVKLDVNILRKMFMAIAKDIRVVLIKLMDRLYNIRQYKDMDESLRKLKAKETLEIYAPIAHRLGISNIKSELEDICFRILYDEDYHIIKTKVDKKKTEREEYISERIDEVREKLKENNVKATIYGRPKHFFSIYKKMKEKNCDIDGLFDLLAIRIIVNSIKDCYTALGIVHSMYKPMPGRFKDYIAVPKTNNYQSLHTTVFGSNGIPFEVQIRTYDMHYFAEYGAAAHFMYKEKSKTLNDTEKKVLWIRQTLELQKDLSLNNETLSELKGELFGEEVFVFTPKGDIRSLPKGSTPIDFAYMIHQNIAEKMVGSKINGKLLPIFTKLNNTDVVEIITSKSSKGPKVDWLRHVKTTAAKNKITSFLKKQGSDIYITRGKEIFEKEVKKSKINKDELLKEEYLEYTAKLLNLNNINFVYENIGFGVLSPVKAANRLVDSYYKLNKISKEKQHKNIKVKKTSTDSIIVEGLSNCLIKFAKCCNPLKGDDIVGYVTCANGISIHRKDCKNLKNLDYLNRKINVKWVKDISSSYNVNIKIFANNRDSLTIDVIKLLEDMKISVVSIKADQLRSNEVTISLIVVVENIDMLNKIIRNLKKIDSVYEVKRGV